MLETLKILRESILYTKSHNHIHTVYTEFLLSPHRLFEIEERKLVKIRDPYNCLLLFVR